MNNKYVSCEVKDLRKECEKHFRLDDGSFAAVLYESPVHYLDEDSNWSEIDNSLSFDGKQYIAKAGKITKSFAASTTEDYPVCIRSEGTSIAMSIPMMIDVNRTAFAKAEISNPEKTSNKESMSLDEASEIKVFCSSVSYKDIYPGVSLVYRNLGYNLKEEIVISKPQQSYRFEFRLKLSGIKPSVGKDGSIAFSSEDKTVFRIPAPYMLDSNGEYSSNVHYELVNSGDCYTLTVDSDSKWINDSSRAFPVIIDPTVVVDSQYGVESVTIQNETPSEVAGLAVVTGVGGLYNSGIKLMRTLVRINTLPVLPAGSVMANAQFKCYESQLTLNGRNSLTVVAKALSSNSVGSGGYWCAGKSWNTTPAPVDSILDYVTISSGVNYHTWDITRYAQDWYENSSSNYGFVLMDCDESSQSPTNNGWAMLVSSITTGTGIKPRFEVQYRSTAGIEDYFSYQKHQIGRAGVGYVSDTSRQITLIKNDISSASTVNPFGLNHVYNSAYSAGSYHTQVLNANSRYSYMNVGYGWQLSAQQTCSYYTNGYAVYADGDGTVHFLKFVGNVGASFVDEDGLGLVAVASDSNFNQYTNYTLYDRKGNIMYFAGGHLRYTQDANGNTVMYNLDSYCRIISVVRQNNGGTGETLATLSYSGNKLSSITDAAGNVTQYSYTGNYLTQITNPDGTTVSYTYNSEGKLLSAKDNESNYSMNYSWSGSGKLTGYAEKAGTAAGAAVSISGRRGITTYRSCGRDRTLNNTDDLITSCVFDYTGRTITSYTTYANSNTIQGAAAAKYTANSGQNLTNNKTLTSAVVGARPVGTSEYRFIASNLLANGDMSGSSGWSNAVYAADSFFGRAIKITGSLTEGRSVSQTVTFSPAKAASQTYIFSAWAKADSVALSNESRSFDLCATLHYSNSETEKQKLSFCADSIEWQYLVLPIVPTKDSTVTSITAEFSFNKNPNTAYFAHACLTEESAQSYKYNADGELISVATPQNETERFTYSGADLISQVTKGNGTYSYEYDNRHNVTKVINDGVNMSVSYDTKGNTSSTVLSDDGTNSTITSSAVYDSTGNYLISQTDARGATVNYSYGNAISRQLGKPTAVTGPSGVTTSTTYNSANGRITKTEIPGTAALNYAYSSGRMSGITRSGRIPGVSAVQNQTYAMDYDVFGNMTGVRVGSTNLASYTYGSRNGQLTNLSYGNGDSVSYSYDKLERVQNVYYNGDSNPALTYIYMGEGTLNRLIDNVNSRTYYYSHDSLGRLHSMTERYGTADVFTCLANYDTANRLTVFNYRINPSLGGALSSNRSIAYSYNSVDGSLSTLATPAGTFEYSYDELKRLSTRAFKSGGTPVLTREYTYLPGSGSNGTSMLVSRVICRRANGAISKIYNYTYDSLGNISSVRGNTNASYTYDSQGQLLTETLDGTTYTYTYDTYGNIRSKSDGTTTVNYTYGSSDWLDLLTEYNGNSIDYDAIGNPTQWYDGTNFTWVNGRRLAGAANTASGLNAAYTYDNTGLRLSKTVNGVEHKYIWNNGKLVSEYYNGTELEFFYDESGCPAAFSYKANTAASPVYYYYLRNLQGDITGIVNSYGSMVANYSYNAWGKLLDIQSYSNGDNIAAINPLRYRGYYYDTELALYYLQSRYYDPKLGRFINADDVAYLGANKDFGSFNLFAYCGNNPAALSDPNGRFSIPQLIIAATVGGLISGISTYLQTGDIRQSIDSGLSGALTGAFCSVGKWPFILAGAIISGIHTAFTAEGSFFKKLVMGITNFGFVTLTGWFGNKLTGLLGNELKNFGEFMFDAEFGTVAIIFDYTIQSFFTTPEKSDVQISVCPHHIGSAQRSEIIRCI